MKNFYTTNFYRYIKSIKLVLILVIFINISFSGFSQERVPFKPRTSEFSPNKTIYSVKGDFTMLGNTNLTLVDYDGYNIEGNNPLDPDNDNYPTNSEDMEYVDVDLDDNTWNSSSSTLSLHEDASKGILPECSTIVYAGLYWTGRAGESEVFEVTKDFPTGNFQTITVTDEDERVYDEDDIDNTNYTLDISSSSSNNNLHIYVFN